MGWNLSSCLPQYVFLTTANNKYSDPLTSLQRWKLMVRKGLNIGSGSVNSCHLRKVFARVSVFPVSKERSQG